MKYVMSCAVLLCCQMGPAVAQPAGLKESAVKMSGRTLSVRYSPLAAGQVQSAAISGNFHTDSNLDIEGVPVPKGDYTLFVLPEAKEWKLIISKPTGAPNPKLEVGRVPMTMKRSAAPADPVRMTLTSFGSLAGKLELACGSTLASVAFSLDIVKSAPEW
jgi:hypothetical protein